MDGHPSRSSRHALISPPIHGTPPLDHRRCRAGVSSGAHNTSLAKQESPMTTHRFTLRTNPIQGEATHGG
jgi:hypothetical protein